MPRRAALLLALAALAACDGGVDSTYPPAGDYPLVSIDALLSVPPGRYNAEGYVIVRPCLPDTRAADCLPGNLELFGTLAEDPPQLAAYLYADPEVLDQFRERARYRFSVEAFATQPGALRAFEVLGYDELGGSRRP